MNIAIAYASVHHKNTEKIVNAIIKVFPQITLIDASSTVLKDLTSYDIIGFASGIFYGKMHKSLTQFINNNLPERKRCFIIYTSGQANDNYGKDVEEIIKQKNGSFLGSYNCRGFDTFGPFKLIGGLQKGHPSADEIDKAVEFVGGFLELN